MYNSKINTKSMNYIENILINKRGTPLKKELNEYINDLPDEILLSVKPLLQMLIENTITIEEIEPSPDEIYAVENGRAEYERGETVKFENAGGHQ